MKQLRVAALNEPWRGDVRGISSANYACFRQARGAGLRGSFRPFLSGERHEVTSLVRFADRSQPIVNLEGETLFTSWRHVTNGDGGQFLQRPRLLSFDGRDVLQDNNWPLKYVWHGSTRYGELAENLNCNNWNVASSSSFGMASALKNLRLLDQEKVACDNALILLCVETSSTLPKRKRRRRRQAEDLFLEDPKEPMSRRRSSMKTT
ncbi:collagen alpha-1(XV) chain-like [Oratosquilla oratoria]|uniref:collagen alpha-1(XV) chain-like n=1 Tax=Oratosquilla oratoria TaxID=337810 RepID=UPI003F76CD64